VWELAFMANVAREIEEPILEHSQQNGEGFRLLLPSLGRFLGKNHEEAAYAASHGLPWCESPWCEEERRHATTFARIIERLTGTSPVHDNPNRPKVVTSSEADAVRLVISRESAEWNSSSTYTVMAAHGTGDLHHLLRNLARDEIKHLAILGGFRGAEVPGSRPDRRTRTRIRRLARGMLRTCLFDRLRDHQIRNNRHVLARRRAQAAARSRPGLEGAAGQALHD
jgi:hypothetical protein